MPFFRQPAVLRAYRDLEAVTLACGEQTKLMRVCQTIDKHYSNDPAAALCYGLGALRMNSAFADLDPADRTGTFLTGDPRDTQSVGFIAACVTKMTFRDWLSHTVRLMGGAAAYQELVEEIEKVVAAHFLTPLSFWNKFRSSGDAVETNLLAVSCNDAYQKFRETLRQEGSL